jgi:hypothetical protein
MAQLGGGEGIDSTGGCSGSVGDVAQLGMCWFSRSPVYGDLVD